MHNLFAMEAFSIAEALGVPSLAVSACLVPQAAPASLQRRFRRVHPALHAALTRPGACLSIASASDASASELMPEAFTFTHFSVCSRHCASCVCSMLHGKRRLSAATCRWGKSVAEEASLCAASEQEGPGLVRWADVEHWLWPLFSNASCTWRQVGRASSQHLG